MTKKRIRWNADKNRILRGDASRGHIGLSECAIAIEEGRLLDDIPNPNYPGQRMFVLDMKGYAYVVPYISENGSIFLKTAFPSRKHTAIYLRRQ